MNSIERRQEILKRLQTNGMVSIQSLADELQVSSMTIRRDLNRFADQGLVRMESGGALLNSSTLYEHNMTIKSGIMFDEKVRIAQKCLDFIKKGDSIFLDAGTTTNELARLLSVRKNLVVMTNSLLAANSMIEMRDSKIIMCPGEFRELSMAYLGPLTASFVSQFTIDTLFLALDGIDLEKGLSVPDFLDGTTKQSLMEHARKVICVADSSKFNHAFLYRIAPLSNIDCIITDNGLDEQTLERFSAKNITIITV